jgi:hypothetical protein
MPWFIEIGMSWTRILDLNYSPKQEVIMELKKVEGTIIGGIQTPLNCKSRVDRTVLGRELLQ